MIFGTYDIWSLLRSGTDTHISDLSEFYYSIDSGMDC